MPVTLTDRSGRNNKQCALAISAVAPILGCAVSMLAISSSRKFIYRATNYISGGSNILTAALFASNGDVFRRPILKYSGPACCRRQCGQNCLSRHAHRLAAISREGISWWRGGNILRWHQWPKRACNVCVAAEVQKLLALQQMRRHGIPMAASGRRTRACAAGNIHRRCCVGYYSKAASTPRGR